MIALVGFLSIQGSRYAGEPARTAPPAAPSRTGAPVGANVHPIDRRLDVWNAGEALLDAGKNEDAARFLEAALDRTPGLVELADGLLEARARLCAPNAAIAFCAHVEGRVPAPFVEIFGRFLDGEKAMVARKFPEAAGYFREASGAARAAMDELSVAACDAALVRALLANQDAAGALAAVKALPAVTPDVPRRSRFLTSIMALEADCLNAADRIGAADSLYRDALARAKGAGYVGVESACVAGLARLDEKRQRYAEARSLYAEALVLERAQGDRERTASFLNNVAQAEIALGALDAAAAHLTEAEEIAASCGFAWVAGYVLYGRGAIAEMRGNKDEALDLFQKSAEAHRAQGNTANELGAELRLGYLRSTLGDYARAIGHYERALKEYEKTKNAYGLSWTLAGLALTYHKLGDFAKAEEYYRRTLDVKRALGDTRGAAWSLNALGGIADMQGRYRDALAFENEAMAIYDSVGDRAGVGSVYYSMGSVYFYLGNDAEALERYEKAFAIAAETNDRWLLGRVVSGMGSAYSSAGRSDLAEALYRKCLDLARASREETEIVWALNNLASLEIEKQEPARARAHLEEALALLPRGGQDYLRARSLYLLGAAEGSGPSSIGRLEEALALAERSGLEELRWKCLSDLAERRLALGDTVASDTLQREAILSVESLRRLAGSNELRTTFLEPAILPYERMVSLILARSGKAADAMDAFGYTERCRAQILASLLREAGERSGSKGGDRLVRRERDILSRLTYYQARLQDGTISPEERARCLSGIEGLERSFVSLGMEIETTEGGYAAAIYPRVERPDVLLSTLAPGERMLSYFLGETRSYLFSAADTQLRVYELPARKVIEERVDSYLRLLQQLASASGGAPGTGESGPGPSVRPIPDEVLDAASAGLYDLLVAPAAPSIGMDERLVIVPDGHVSRLPFAMLRHGDRYLVQDHDISYAPSLRTLRYLRERNGIRARSRRMPEYGVIAVGASGESADGSPSARRVYPFTEIPIEPLAGAAQEAKDVAHLFDRPLVLTGRGAEESAFKASRLYDAGILHIAAHAYIDNDDLRRSFVVLNPERGFGDSLAVPGNDGILQWQEVAALKLNAALVTLAACRSAGGIAASGEGISGLTEAFLYAGAGCVLAAQLDVPDDLAGAVMTEYYRNVADGADAAAALSAAQRSILAKGGPAARPAVWGAFVAIGDGASAPRLIPELTRTMYVAMILFAAGVVIGAVAILRRRRFGWRR